MKKTLSPWFFVVLALGILLTVTAALPPHLALFRVLEDSAHAPMFALITALLLRTRIRAGQPHRSVGTIVALVVAAALAIAVATELLQFLIPYKDPSIHDLLSDSAGIVIATSAWLLFAQGGSRTAVHAPARIALCTASLLALLYALVPLATCLAAYQRRNAQLPQLLQPSHPLDAYFISTTPAYSRLERGFDMAKHHALRLTLPAGLDYPGFALSEPYPDWSGYETLLMTAENRGTGFLQMRLRIHDATHDEQMDDRFNTTLALAPGERQEFRIPLEAVAALPNGRTLDLRAVAGLVMFRPVTAAPDAAGEIWIHRIALENRSESPASTVPSPTEPR